MSSEETKPVAVPVESAANEVDDAKKLEGSVDVVPSAVKSEDNATNGTASTTGDATASASVVKTEEEPKLSDSEREDQVVQDAVKQISFYFSDSNLPYDKFLFFQAQDGNKDPEAPMGTGWVSLSTVLSFKRMQEIIARSSRSATICEFAIVNALRAAYPSSDENALIEISSDGNDIRRKQPLREPGKTDQMSRSVYVKGFPEEEQKSNDRNDRGGYVSSQLQKDLERWFESLGLGKVNAVRMRRDDQKHFKQSVFVEFATIESAKALVELDPKPTYKGQTEPVEVMFKKDYIDMKAKEKGIAPQYASGRPTNAPAGNNAKRPFNAFKDYKRDNESKPQKVTVYVEGKEMEVDSETGKLKNPEELSYTSGKILKFDITEGSDEFNPYHLKQALNPVHAAAFVDFEKGSSSGVAFFKEPVTEEILQKIKDTDLKLGSAESKLACTWTLIEGDEEKKFHLDRANKRASIALADSKAEDGGRNKDDRRGGDRRGGRDQRGGRGRGGRGGGRGGRGGNRDNRGGRSDDRNRENYRKRARDDENSSPVKREASPARKGNSISVPVADSTGPAAPPAKKVKQED
ncbi:hypothetical protein P389DRAFT_208292 [Cystobasidium minutum MCA 4210]|uniref:uncharacterized protein n=1 Tax=Cystobasidium minutum MCA 4210 TaxID=1397322 RepID=UPI0034CF4AA0|eukprot:jgi/Rhomi1/208292/estExt_Genemark1.C_1_t30337